VSYVLQACNNEDQKELLGMLTKLNIEVRQEVLTLPPQRRFNAVMMQWLPLAPLICRHAETFPSPSEAQSYRWKSFVAEDDPVRRTCHLYQLEFLLGCQSDCSMRSS
jgi:hypothetical protein